MTVRQLDMELKKLKGESQEEVNIPLVNLTPSLETIVNNAEDINPVRELHDVESMLKPNQEEVKLEEPDPKPVENSTPNKFFNFLEDEAANMNMTSNLLSNIPPINPLNNDIEILDDGLSEAKEESSEELPFFFAPKNDNMVSENTIEEIKEPTTQEEIIDPVSSIVRLDPNYEQKIEEEKGIDLKTAINEVRKLNDTLNAKGFLIELEELDLMDNYQIIFKIKK